jgi:hypothetical protein
MLDSLKGGEIVPQYIWALLGVLLVVIIVIVLLNNLAV